MNDSTVYAGQTDKIRVVKKKTGMSRLALEEALYGYLFIAPVVLGLALFYTLPSVASLGLSFTDWDGLSAPGFSGLANFTALMQDEVYIRSIVNTLIITFVSVPLNIAIATVLAVLLNQKIKGRTVYRTMYFLPVITMPIAVGMVWRWLYNSEYGLINYFLRMVHLPGPNWLTDERFILFSIVLVIVWSSVGYNAIILLSGLQGIASTYYEAASLDGAGPFYRFFRITLPLVTPSLFFVLIISLINTFQTFDLIFIMMGSQASALDSTRTIVYSIWENGFKYSNMGYASAQALVLFLIILVITIAQVYFQKKWVHYQ